MRRPGCQRCEVAVPSLHVELQRPGWVGRIAGRAGPAIAPPRRSRAAWCFPPVRHSPVRRRRRSSRRRRPLRGRCPRHVRGVYSPRRSRWTRRSTRSSADPTDETLAAAKEAWLAARDDYGLTEAFRFYGGPIDNEENGPEGLINAWPLDEAYIDYVDGDARRRHHQRSGHVPDDRRRAAHVAQRAGRRGEHLDRLARHRVPALGPGPVRRRPRRRARSPTTRPPTTPIAGRRT